MLTYEDRNCKYVELYKQILHVSLRMIMETASMVTYENGNCKYA